MSEEIWRPVVGHEGAYEVSSLGNVRSLDRVVKTARGQRRYPGKNLTLRVNPRGYLTAPIKHATSRLVHHLVLESFVGPRPDGLDGCHNDGSKMNNRAENLRWDTRSANINDAVRHRTHNRVRNELCPRGHPYDSVKPYRKRNGEMSTRRVCLTCQRDGFKRHYYANRDSYLERLYALRNARKAST